jgi:uncharacterized membrane protein YedE/YeeE
MLTLIALATGTLFGAGLAVSGMINPQKILNFLDVAAIAKGGWDPTLGVVFAAALAPMFVAYAVQRRGAKPYFEKSFHIPSRDDIDTPLVAGSVLFGAGWGLVGLCPGPAIAGLAAAGSQLPALLVFSAAMIAGILVSIAWRHVGPEAVVR